MFHMAGALLLCDLLIKKWIPNKIKLDCVLSRSILFDWFNNRTHTKADVLVRYWCKILFE